ncbi:MAG: Do family serine endopeptidase [Chitinophagales bacterium]|nr:Do family serine endopeptidase [Chitinophagales bacterium]
MKIKTFITLLIASFAGAMLAIWGYKKFFPEKPTVHFIDPTPTKLANFQPAVVQPADFRYAAAIATPCVVHIKSTYRSEAVTMRGRDPFRDFFGDDFFHFFYGPNPPQVQPKVSTGSGVIVSKDGYIVTNNHVVENADEINVTLHNNKNFKAKMIGRDPDTDLALIKIETDDLPFIKFADSDSVMVGEWVLAVGNPFNLSSTVTAGIVSAKARNINILARSNGSSAIESFIQTDAAVNPGNSGGALVNISGNLIGINTAIASPTGSYAGYSFAVPSNIVKKVVFDLQKYGATQRGFLGVQIRTVDDELAQKVGLSKPMGVYIETVNEGSAGKEAGLKPKDVILKINGVSVNSAPELQEQVARYRPGDKITVDYYRDGKFETTTVTLKNKYNTTSIVDNSKDILDALGLELSEISPAEKKQLGIESGVKVTNIKSLKIKEFTDILNVFFITQVDDQPVQNINDFVNILKNKSGKVLLEGIYPGKPMSYLYAFRM